MRGHVEERGKNCFRIKVYLGRDAKGRKQYHTEVFHGSKREAQDRAVAIANEINKRTFTPPAKVTVREHFQRWLNYIRPPEVRETTYNLYEYISRVHILPALGDVPLNKLTTSHVLDFLHAVRTGPRKDGKPGRLSQSTIKHIYDVLHIALEAAVKWRALPRGANPMDDIDPPKIEDKEMAVWSVEQVRAFIAAIRQDKYYAAYLLAVFGGLRRGEILGLRWQDIDWRRRRISINQQVVKGGDGKRIQGELKTKRGRRQVTVTREILEALRERRSAQVQEKMAYEELYGPGSYQNLDLVFPNEAGQPLYPDTFSKRFKKLVRRLGLRELRLHDTRHTSASLMVAAGTHPKVMAERLGDTVETVLSMYAHVLPGLQADVAENLEQVLSEPEESELEGSADAGFPLDSHSRVH